MAVPIRKGNVKKSSYTNSFPEKNLFFFILLLTVLILASALFIASINKKQTTADNFPTESERIDQTYTASEYNTNAYRLDTGYNKKQQNTIENALIRTEAGSRDMTITWRKNELFTISYAPNETAPVVLPIFVEQIRTDSEKNSMYFYAGVYPMGCAADENAQPDPECMKTMGKARSEYEKYGGIWYFHFGTHELKHIIKPPSKEQDKTEIKKFEINPDNSEQLQATMLLTFYKEVIDNEMQISRQIYSVTVGGKEKVSESYSEIVTDPIE